MGMLGWLSQASRTALGALCALVLVACSDGYPTDDVPQADPTRMTQAQLLAALNAMGKEPQLGKRWRYVMHAGCELEISVRDGDASRRRVELKGTTITTRSVEGISAIRLVPKAGSETQAVTALETRRWSDTVRARALLTHLEVRCGRPEVPSA